MLTCCKCGSTLGRIYDTPEFRAEMNAAIEASYDLQAKMMYRLAMSSLPDLNVIARVLPVICASCDNPTGA